MRPQTFYDRYWRDFHGWSPSNVSLSRLESDFLRRYLRPGLEVIEYGAGDCAHYGSVILASQVNYIGLDISEVAVQRCRERGMKAIVHDLNEPVPFSDDSFDVALCIEVLEHLFRPDATLKDIYRVLKPGGVALITVPNIVYWPNRVLFLLGFFNPGGSPVTSLREPWRDPHIRFFTRASLLKLLERTGFTVIEFKGEFSLAHLPFIYKLRRIKRVAEYFSIPLRPLGYFWPSVFAFRFFVVAKKPN